MGTLGEKNRDIIDSTGRRRSSLEENLFSSIPKDRPRSHPTQFKRKSFQKEPNGRGSKEYSNRRGERNSLTISPRPNTAIHESKSLLDLNQSGDSSDLLRVTQHELYKEALYTCIHMLGTPSPKRFPSTQEEMCMYTHETFSVSQKEQIAVMNHVMNEPYPLTIVNSKVRRADGLKGSKGNGVVDPYCVVTVETDNSLGRKEWQQFSTASPIRNKELQHNSINLRPIAEDRPMQIYEKIPQFIKTSVQRHKSNPTWDQRFQCLSLRPSVDKLTIEVWDHSIDDKYVAKAIRGFSGAPDLDSTLKEFHENADRKKGDVFLGKVALHISEIPCDGIDKSFKLTGIPQTKDKEPSGRIRIQIWLVHAYRHGRHFAEIAEPKLLLGCLWDWVLKTEKAACPRPKEWDGSIPAAATSLLFQYALQNGISEDTHYIIRWNAYAKHDLNLQGVEERLKELNTAMDKQDRTAQHEQLANLEEDKPPKRVRESQANIEDNIIEIVKSKICPIIRNHLKEHIDAVHEALRSYHESIQVLLKFNESEALPQIKWLFDSALRMSILEWYQETHTRLVPTRGEIQKSEYVSSVLKVMMEVNALLKHGEMKWSPEFWLTANTEYLPVVYDELQKMVIHDVEAVCWLFFEYYFDNKKLRKILIRNDDKDRALSMAFFDLYAQTQMFVFAQQEIYPEGKKSFCCLNEYHRWFRPTLVLWLGFAFIRGSGMINKTINIDSHLQDNQHAMTSSSALDTVTVFCQLINFWNTLNWPDIAEGYVIFHFLMDVICAYTLLYAELKHAKLEREGYYDPTAKFTISERLCTALNNIEYVKEHMQNIPIEVNYDHLVELLEQSCGKSSQIMAYEDRAESLRMHTTYLVDMHMNDILSNVGIRIKTEVCSFIEESFKGVLHAKNNELEQAMEPVISYLEDNIITLQKALLPHNFLRVLQLLWNLVCVGMKTVALKINLSDTSDQVMFFNRILQIVPYLQSYFQGGDAGLSMNEMKTPEFEEMLGLMSLFTKNTDDLIDLYYHQTGIKYMNDNDTATLGTIRIRIGYWNEKLGVEIMSAQDLQAHDEPLGFFKYFHTAHATSDPLVEMELEPATYFELEKKHATKVLWKNLNPVFDETFYWDIDREDCLKPSASLVLTVKDYDLLRSNAFLGEAIIPLHVIPGISSNPEPQPMNLKLHNVDPQTYSLQVLNTRSWDTKATDFFNRQAVRYYDEPNTSRK